MSPSARDKDEEKKGSWVNTILVTIFILVIFFSFPVPCQSHLHSHDHGHDHDHDHHDPHILEPPNYKYSKQANERFIEKKLTNHQEHHHHKREKIQKKTISDVFVPAMGSTLLISIAPFLALYLVPLDNSRECQPLLKILLSFASGGLLGDAFLHLIPHALSSEHHHHDHLHDSTEDGHSHDTSVGLCVLGGIVMFLLVEKAVHLIKGGHSHSHSHHASEDKSKQNHEEPSTSENAEKDKSDNVSNKCEKHKVVHDIKVAGYLNLAADFLHNFTDGLAIGASYLAGNAVGYVTTFTILLHEVPHEIGDFAILIQSGCSKPKAIMLQLVTAIGALLGTFISLLVGGLGDVATRWILPFTAGGFIYIATVTVIPELLIDTKFWQSVKEIIAILIGVYMMVLVTQYE